MQRPSWVTEGVDIDRPNAARMYDYALGGSHNFAVDRALVEQAEAAMPGARQIAHANRAFLRRVVQRLATDGVRQFLDIGSGIPTRGNVHEVAQRVAPGARVLYVDIDPVAVAHSRTLLVDNPDAHAVQGDLRDPDRIVGHPEVRTLLDFSRPVAVLLFAVLHFIGDADDPAGIVGRLHDAVPGGSYLAVSHGTPPTDRGSDADTMRRIYQRTPTPLHLRTHDQVLPLIQPFELVEPGLVPVSEWHPEDADRPQRELLGAVATARTTR
jgi:SAM-dependent methyltransferase